MSDQTKEDVPTAFDVRGVSALIVDAVTGVTGIVEDMHGAIGGGSRPGGARGIPGLVYRSIHGITRRVGRGQHTALEKLAPLLRDDGEPSPQRETAVGVLNGVMGDYLEATGNPMAIPMHLRRDGQPLVAERPALEATTGPTGDRLLVLVHGLCLHGDAWHRDGHDHGASLAIDAGYTAIYLSYNSGRHISTNGREFADTLERLVEAWPVPVRELVLVGHSMGGLVSRSACHYGLQAGHRWLHRLKTCVFLGTPHHGAPLERAGNWAGLLLGMSPYTAPLARVSAIRSAGIQDLRYGSILDEDWEGRDDAGPHDPREQVPLPDGVVCWAIAATREPRSDDARSSPPAGDGLVPVPSALGRHDDPGLSLPIPPTRQILCYGLKHLDLLASPEVYHHIRLGVAHAEDGSEAI